MRYIKGKMKLAPGYMPKYDLARGVLWAHLPQVCHLHTSEPLQGLIQNKISHILQGI